MSAQVTASDDPQVTGPLVFSCLKCKSIVGDSFSLLSSNEEANTITLSASSNIQRPKEMYTSYESLDEGSTYFPIMCKFCQQSLGRYYVTTSTDLDHLREKFTFNIDAITSYELGKAQHGKMLEVTVLSLPVADEVAEEGPAQIETVQEDVTKIQHVLVDLVQRMGDLERELAAVKKRAGDNSHENTNSFKRTRP